MSEKAKELVEKYEPLRKDIIKPVKICTFIGIPLALLGIVFFFVLMPVFANPIFLAIGAPILVAGIVLLVIAFKREHKFNAKMFEEIKKDILDLYIPERIDEPRNGFTKEQILFPGFFYPRPDKWDSDSYLAGTYKGIPFKQSSYKLSMVSTDSNNNTRESVYAQGTMFFFDFEREFGTTVKIMERKSKSILAPKQSGLKAVETEYIEFNKKFQILTSDMNTTFYILTPQIQEKIMQLEKSNDGGFFMAFIGSDLYVAIDDFSSTASMSAFKRFTLEKMDKLINRISRPFILIDELGLSKDKFKTNAGIKM